MRCSCLPAARQRSHRPLASTSVRKAVRRYRPFTWSDRSPRGALYVDDKVRVWGIWDRDQGVLRAWRVEVWERSGRPASDIVTTGRPFPLLLISAVLLGFLLLTCLCGVLTR